MTPKNFWTGKTVLLTGAAGFLGSHIVDVLRARGVAADRLRRPSIDEADLTKLEVCRRVVRDVNVVLHIAGKVGGIGLNRERPGELFYENLLMGIQLMEEARLAGVDTFLALGTTCEYPKITPVPFREADLWNGYPDEITGPYGLAKKMLLVQGETYRRQYGFKALHLIPTNLYGPRDHFDDVHGHVIPALIKRFLAAAEAKAPEVVVWGAGRATREFLYVEDAAEGIVRAAEAYDDPAPVNLGSGVETPVRELAETIAELTGFTGKLVWDTDKPDGQPRRSLDVSRAQQAFGFRAGTPLREGLKRTVDWYRENRDA